MKKNDNLSFSTPLSTNVSDKLSSVNIYTPMEQSITLHCFFIMYLRTCEERNIDYPVVFDKTYDEGTISWKKAFEIMYNNYTSNSALKANLTKLLKNIYSDIHLTFDPKQFSREDLSMIIISKMLFRAAPKVQNELNFDDTLKFNMITHNISILKYFENYSLDNLYDYDTLGTNRWADDKSSAVINSIIRNAVSKDYSFIHLNAIWGDILYLLQILKTYINVKEYLENAFLQHMPQDTPDATNNIITEYKYRLDLYDFATGILTTKSLCNDIIINWDKFWKSYYDELYDEFYNQPLPIKALNKKFIHNHHLGKIICKNKTEGNDLDVYDNKIAETLKGIHDAIKIICQQVDYTARQHFATIWLYKNGNDIQITYHKSYRKNTNVPKTLSALMKCHDSSYKERSKNSKYKEQVKKDTNMRYNQLVITNFIEAYMKYCQNDTAYLELKLLYLETHTILMNFIEELESKYAPSYVMKTLEKTFTDIFNELSILKKIALF